MKRKIVAMINGYGVPWNIYRDENYEKYLTTVCWILERYDVMNIYLTGGYTNDPCVSEANAMLDWFINKKPDWRKRLYLLERSVTARQNIEDFCCTVNSQTYSEDYEIMIFCEYSRRHAMSLIARRFSSVRPKIKGIKFDQVSLAPINRLKAIFKCLDVVAGLYVPLIYKWQKKARQEKLLTMQEERLKMYEDKSKLRKLSPIQRERLKIYRQRMAGC